MFAILRYSQTKNYRRFECRFWWESEVADQVRRLFIMSDYTKRDVNFNVLVHLLLIAEQIIMCCILSLLKFESFYSTKVCY